MKAIIFGANGQDGFYLNKLLQKENVKVTGVSRSGNFLRTDLSSLQQVHDLISRIQPDFIFHLAANSTTRHDALFENHETIATGTLNILEAVRQVCPEAKVFISGSGLQFLNEGKPIKESDPFAANDAYAVSRIQSVYAARYFRTLGLKVYTGYFFNHDSPLRSERHMAKKISAAAARIAAESNEKLEIGDMEAVKEWAFAGDIVKGIWLLVSQDAVFEANISNGEGHSIREWVALCFSLKGLHYEDHVVKAEGFTSSYRQLISDNSIIKSLGYVPEVSFKALAEKMLAENE